ncbi:mitochondrial arginine transporter BAC2, partial [Trifolium medium]|nr:mitochondrial arginine transporter BAC2 [Trifolium medium]
LNQDIGPLSPLAVTLAAGFSGSVAAAASHGFDTARITSPSSCCMIPVSSTALLLPAPFGYASLFSRLPPFLLLFHISIS